MAKIYSIITLVLLFTFFPLKASAANLSVSPSSNTVTVGSRLTLKIIASGDVSFNAVSGVVSFPTSIFTIESVSKTSSILNFWVTEPTISKSVGTVKFEGVSLGGFQGTSGTVVTVTLKAIKVGTGKVTFQSGQILANDGEGTDITGNMSGGTYTVKEAPPTPPTPTPPVPEPEPIPEPPQPPPTLKAPEIELGQKYGAPAILGTSEYPNSQALITFVSEKGVKIFITDYAENDGSFVLLVPYSLKRGKYNVSAIMIKDDGTHSNTSREISIKVGNIFSDITWEVWVIIALLVLTILYLLIRIYFYIKNRRETKKNIEREVLEAEDSVRKSFDILRDDLKNRSQSIVNSVDRQNVAELEKDISYIEKNINKEIEDIDV
jgi:hypothetical protein